MCVCSYMHTQDQRREGTRRLGTQINQLDAILLLFYFKNPIVCQHFFEFYYILNFLS